MPKKNAAMHEQLVAAYAKGFAKQKCLKEATHLQY